MAVTVVAVTDLASPPAAGERLGGERWSSLLAAHRAAAATAAAAQAGRLAGPRGDGAVLTFASARAALLAAAAVRHALRHWAHPSVGVDVRIGVHAGPLVDDGGSVRGPALEGAAAIAGLAGPGEVMVSAAVRALAAGDRDLTFGPASMVRLGPSGRRFSVAPLLAQRLTIPAARRSTAMHRSST